MATVPSGPNFLAKSERERIKYHLGYLNTFIGSSVSLGLPSASQLLFILENSMNDVIIEALPLVRRAVLELDCIEDQLSESRANLATRAVNGIQFNPVVEQSELESQYSLWAKKLADIFGVPLESPQAAAAGKLPQTHRVVIASGEPPMAARVNCNRTDISTALKRTQTTD